MKTLILDGSNPNDPTGERVRTALLEDLAQRGWQVQYYLVSEQKIGNCAGDFFCWVRSPGICNVDDDNRKIAAAIVHSDLLIYLTPVTFGGYSSTLKRAVDHQIQNIAPFFKQVNGETHHEKRYKRYPDFLTIGWLESPDPEAEAVFRHLTWRNGINFHAKTQVSGVILGNQGLEQVQGSVHGWLNDIAGGHSSEPGKLPKSATLSKPSGRGKQALLLVGSPRTRKSTSAALGNYLFTQLEQAGMQTETFYVHTSLRNPQRWQALMEAVNAADLVVVAFPLYVDTLPAPLIEAFERLAAARVSNPTRSNGQAALQRLAAIGNCGFPEAAQIANALAICERFAQQSGFVWAGALALGSGEGIVHGQPLEELDGRAAGIKAALELAASALADGEAIPQPAANLMEKPVIPGWAYRLLGDFGWKQQARQYDAQKMLKRQPYL